MLLGLDVAPALVDVQLARDLAVVLEREQQLVRVHDRHGPLRLDVAGVDRPGLVAHDVQHRFVHVGGEHQGELLEALDDLVHVFDHPRDRLVLVHHAVDPERPDGGAPQRGQEHPAQRVSQRVAVAPLERGYGYTLGNALRRMLLSSLRGAAVWAFRIDGVVHEHQTIPGVVEDVHQIIQRLKQLTLMLSPDVDEAVLHVKRDKAGPVHARDIEAQGAVTIVNADQLLFTLQDDREIAGELYVNKGRGYVEAEQHPLDRTLPVDVVRVDSIYNPVRRANFTVAETRVGQRTDYDRLTLTVETNGTISPEDAVAYAAALAQEHFR